MATILEAVQELNTNKVKVNKNFTVKKVVKESKEDLQKYFIVIDFVGDSDFDKQINKLLNTNVTYEVVEKPKHPYGPSMLKLIGSKEDLSKFVNHINAENAEIDYEGTRKFELSEIKPLKEECHVCPKCGKEVCECAKNEELNEATNSFINEFGIPTIDPEFENVKEELTEDVESTMPATPLSQAQILDFVHSDEKATASKGPMGKVFKLGYIAEATDGMVASQYRGGRGSVNKETGEALPRVRIFKCTEYTGCYLENYSDSKVVKAARAGEDPETSHERKGYTWVERGVFKKNGTELLALAPLMRSDFSVKRKFYLSIDGGDLVEASKEEIAQYCKPSALAPRPAMADGGRPTFTFLFKGIYMLGNLGHSIM